ncbi:MAG: glycosyltransferase N-terminal domain-containing protein [Gammaproteobacteria bacterium]|nr:glycosyltransferase N-terminal domain-containing protein [Gammaproteobacteria bacterium]
MRRKSGLKFIMQRLGWANPKVNGETIWIHASSIGETKIALTLYSKLSLLYPETLFFITTTTSTSKSLITESKKLKHYYLPLDWLLTIKRFITLIKPKICIVIETEIWPNLINICNKNKIPIMIVNGRISSKTSSANNLIKSIYKIALQKIDLIMCKSELEEENFKSLGGPKLKTEVIGNIKFSQYNTIANQDNIINKKYVLALSTHPDEERQIITEWLKTYGKKVLLVIAPRHPERLGDILSDLPLDMLEIAIRSKNERIRSSTQIYIADTIGETESLIEHSEFIFVGGSLVDHGGQNFLEAASYGKSIIVGPYMYNFISETEEFLKNNAMIMVKSSNTLKHVFERLLKSKQRRELFGENAKKIMIAKKDIVDNYCKTIKRFIS